MFLWQHEYFLDVNFPLQKVWDYCLEPTNWPKLNERFESCSCEGKLKEGSTVKVKIKSKIIDIYMPVYIKNLNPYECTVVMKSLLCNQANHCTFHEISPTKTRILVKTSIKSIFTPFMKSYFDKKLEQAKSKDLERILEVIEKDLTPML